MYKVNDYLKYCKEVCRVKEINKKKFNDQDYYLLVPIKDESLKIEIPTNSDKISKLISKEELEDLICKMPYIEPINIEEKFLESEYKKLIQTGEYENIIKVIITTYLRNKERHEKNKRLTEKDINYLELAEDYLYNEFSIVLDKTVDDTRDYITKKIDEILVN